MGLSTNSSFEKKYIWGAGKLLHRYFSQFPSDIVIDGIIDRDEKKHGDILINEMKIKCFGAEVLTSNDTVIIAIENPRDVNEIVGFLESKEIKWRHLFDVVDDAFINSGKYFDGEKRAGKIKKFIDVTVPIAKCNMKCEYCYLSQLNVELDKVSDVYHDAKYIRYALSQERLGGSAFINLCGVGETLLCENIVEIVVELLKEGHYIQIVTNATPTNIIKSFINSISDSSRLFFKCSLHFEEMKRLNLLNVFAYNINALDEWGASYSIEYVPMDKSVSLIPEIKKYCIDNFGALPHITVARDERFKDFRILSNYSVEEYRDIWGQFDSKMFNFKMDNMDSKRYSNCKAGLWAAELNLANGELLKCTGNPRLCNIYEDLNDDIFFEEVGGRCCLPYCFNCHAYLTLGLMPDIVTPTYFEMRDRVKSDGTHWVKERLMNVFSQKLYENNGV